jgi:diadenosine tetraphosphatase ApaH/serine/threonine PP2A family protein phosphatase
MCDLLWSDPVDKSSNKWEKNTNRGCSFYFSPIQADKFVKKNNITLIIRAHEVQMNGYKYQ